MTAHILFGATNQATSTLALWATQPGGGAVNLGVAITQGFDPVRIGGATLFIGGSPQGLPELWSTDGTVGGTVPFALDDASGAPLAINAMRAWNGGAVIAATNPQTHVDSVWFTDGTATGARLLVSGVAASGFSVVGGTLYFAAYPDRLSGSEQALYKSDGTAAGTVPISPPGAIISPDAYAALASGGILFENGGSGPASGTLWVSNGQGGASQLTPDNLGSESDGDAAVPADMVGLGGRAVFSASAGDGGGSVLWVSDGTSAGTRQIAVPGGITLSAATGLIMLGGSVLFAGVTASGQSGLWVTDGSDAGTRELGAFAAIASLTLFGSKVAFTALDPQGHPSLYVTDGTAGGTTLIAPAGTASTGLDPQGLFAYFDEIGFTGTDQSGRSGVWLSDGTSAGTSEIATPDARTVETGTDQAGGTLIAGSGNLVILGAGAQTYAAGDGDTVRAGSGGDTVTAASGVVQLSGGAGTLLFVGGSGADTVTGGAGAETILAGAGGGLYSGGANGHNVLVASAGNTTLIGGGAQDALFGAASGLSNLVAADGGESLVGGGGATLFTGGALGGAVMFTGDGPATVDGGASGHDTIVGGAGTLQVECQQSEAVFTGSGAATVNASASGADSIIGGAGTLIANAAGSNMIVVGGAGPSAIATGTGYGLIFQGRGGMQITSGGGPLQVVAGPGEAAIAAGAGGITLEIVNGHAGGLDVIGGFKPARDHIDLFGFTTADMHTHAQNGSLTISMSDGSRVTLLGVTDPASSVALI